MKELIQFGDRLESGLIAVRQNRELIRFGGIFTFEHFRNGKKIDEWIAENIVTNVGYDDIIDKYLKGSAYTAAFYIGLTAATPSPVAGDTMATHGGWTEFTAYSEANRQTLTLGTVSGQSVDNSASKAAFSINAASQTVGGAFCVTDNTKSGTTGVLLSCAAFSGGNKTGLDSGDTLQVTYTFAKT